jgi:DNA-binding MarR family transcriptional regulator
MSSSSADTPDSSTLPESLRLLSLIWSFDAALERTSHAMEAKLGVTGHQRFLLRFVGLAPGITGGRLARLVSREPADLQSDLESLVSKHLLTESHGSEGFYLTAQGAAVNAVMTGTIEQAVSKTLDDASPYERTSFRRMLERVLQHLGSG